MTKHEKWLKKLGLKEIEVHMGMFDYTVVVVIGNDKNLVEYVSYKFRDDMTDLVQDEYEARGKTLHKTGYVPIIWIPKRPRTAREYATLAHEALHAMYHVHRWAGFELNDSTEEVMAHGMAHIINTVLKQS